ncbi:MAG: hypothetical protein BM485_04530 [Desulfobulbaceae bacterium DB1]|nr:MAG: hypothetical protein BM485_04530 [Desulfobulbaceae bacterium DB1]
MRNKIIVFLSIVFFAGVLVSLPLASQEERHDHPADREEISDNHATPHGTAAEPHDDHDGRVDQEEDTHAEPVDKSDGEAEHEEEELLLTDEQKKEIGIATAPASSGKLHSELTLTGELMLNEDAVAHIVPRVSGVAVQVDFTFGDTVKKGDVLAVLESAELGKSISEYMVSRKIYERKRKLYEEKIAGQNDYLEALNRFEQVTADLYMKLGKEKYLQAARMFESRYLPATDEQAHPQPLADSLAFVERTTRYEITAPISGTIIEKHLTRGEKVGEDVSVFTIADLSTVWVDLQVPTRDISSIQQGMSVAIESQDGLKTEGKVAAISPVVDAETRTATARIAVENHRGDWMPGSFVTGSIRVSDENLPLVIPRNAVQGFEGKEIVFLADDHGFRHVPVVSGRHDRDNVEILSGLQVGRRIVTKGAFELKAILQTNDMDSHAGHGH